MLIRDTPLTFGVFGLGFVEDGFEGTLDYVLALVVFWPWLLLISNIFVGWLLFKFGLGLGILLRAQL